MSDTAPESSSSHTTSSSSLGESTHSSHWIGWTLGLIAVPVLYVLTYPPVVYTTLTLAGASRTSPPKHTAPLKWLRVYGKPLEWTGQYPQVQKFMQPYVDWWKDVYGF